MEYRKLYDGDMIYHFCAKQFLDGIRKRGLRYGKVPWGDFESFKLITGYQWLTSNPEFQQTWVEGSSLKYDRTECRISIMLPNAEKFNLIKWMDFGKDNPLFETMNAYGDPENWYLFKGVVIPYWISNIEFKPTGNGDKGNV